MGDSINTVVLHLRECAERLRDLYAEDPTATVYFPADEPRTDEHTQPVQLLGYVPTADVAGLLYYVADMLEE